MWSKTYPLRSSDSLIADSHWRGSYNTASTILGIDPSRRLCDRIRSRLSRVPQSMEIGFDVLESAEVKLSSPLRCDSSRNSRQIVDGEYLRGNLRISSQRW